MLKDFKQRGQILVLYAFFVPTIIIFMGAAMEFGWWFFNQSRLQNAADAAVLAGARQITGSYSQPGNLTVEFVNKRPNDSSLVRKSEGEIPTFNNSAAAVTEAAEDYADKNFDYENFKQENFFQDYAYVNTANFNAFSNKETPELKPLYYVVELQGKVEHLFAIMERNFGDMNIHVVAVTRISGNYVPPLDKDPIIQQPFDDTMKERETSTVIVGNWEVQNYFHSNKNNSNWKKYSSIYGDLLFDGQWNHYRTYDKKITQTTKNGRAFSEENLIIMDGTKGSAFKTPANGQKIYTWDKLESINIDFTQDFTFKLKSGVSYLTEDWDIGYPTNTAELSSVSRASNYNGNITLRTHSQFAFDEAFRTRPNQTYPDPLGVRIESEPMWSKLGFQNQTTLNTVRQIILNINEPNVSEEDDDITYRPLVIYYNGPETNVNNPNLTADERSSVLEKSLAAAALKVYYDANGVKYVNGVPYDDDEDPKIRDSQPVIINLNAEFDGIFYMPTSPVVLNGNGNDFRGFIVAKKYLLLKTESDFETENGRYFANIYDENGNITARQEYFKLEEYVNGVKNTMFVDDKNNVQYKKVPSNFTYQYGEFETFGDHLLQETFFTADNPYANFAVKKLSYNLLTYSDHAETEDDN